MKFRDMLLTESDDKSVTIKFQQGMKSTWKAKTFKNQAALEKWMDKHSDDISNISYSYSN